MFALIIALVSIALVAALAVATMWYGGGAFTNNKTNAAVAQIMTSGAQISGAVEAYKAQNAKVPATVDELVSVNLLNAVPQGQWTFANNYIVQSTVNAAQCTEANRRLGITGIPACTDAAVNGVTACCSST